LPAFPACGGNGGVRLHPVGVATGGRDASRQLTKILDGCGQGKFVMRAGGTAQSQSIQLQDALQMGEQHLDLFPIAT